MSVRRVLAVLLVVLSTAAAAVGALSAFHVERTLSVGTVRLSSTVGHRGALDLYVPLVDWGVRFPGTVRVPARVSLDLRTVNRQAARRLARGTDPDVDDIRREAEDAIGSYVRLALAFAAATALIAGILVALALRGGSVPLRLLLPAALGGALACVVALALLLPPRGSFTSPEYYANGPDIPVALRAIEQATRSSDTLSEELNAQLVGLARLIALPAGRAGEGGLPRITVASDLHNNVLALPTLERAVGRSPLFFAGDLTSAGSPLEAQLTGRVARVGRPLVFVSGNHDSDALVRQLAGAGAIVLTQRGRLLPGGGRGPVVVRVAGLRVAGYSDPFERRRADRFHRRGSKATPAQQREFAAWLRPLLGRVDVVLVHEPQLAELAVRELRADPPRRPLAILTGHTHVSSLRTSENLVELNGGTAGGGGTGNLEKNQPFGLAVLTFQRRPAFRPLAADRVQIDAQTGAAKAVRSLLDLGRR